MHHRDSSLSGALRLYLDRQATSLGRYCLNFEFPRQTHANDTIPNLFDTELKPYETVWGAIGDLPPTDEPSETAKRIAKTIKQRIETHGY